MTAYKEPKMINKIINSAPDNYDFYVHLDKKCCIEISEIDSRAHTYKIYKIYWGGIEHLKAFLFLLKEAHLARKKYDFYHLVTGQDFYAIPFNKVDSLLKADTPYIDCFKLPLKNWWHGGLHILQYRTLSSFFDVRNTYVKCIEKTFEFLQRILHIRRCLPNYSLWGGSVYCSLPNGAVEYCLNSIIAKDLMKRLKNTTCGEEIFFQTVMMNSPYKDKLVNDNLRYIDWSVQNGPKVLDLSDIKKVCTEQFLFCRKVDFFKSQDFLDGVFRYINQ